MADLDFNFGQGTTARALKALSLTPEMLAANPNYFGGTKGIVKNTIWEKLNPMNKTYETYGGSPTSNSGTLRDAMPEGLTADGIRLMGNDAPQAWRDLVSAQDAAAQVKDPLQGRFQLTPSMFGNRGFGTQYIDDLSGMTYDPEYGYTAPESAWRQTEGDHSDPFLKQLTTMLAVAGGIGGVFGGLGVAGEALGGAGTWLEGITAADLAAAGYSAADIAALTQAGASTLGGLGGFVDGVAPAGDWSTAFNNDGFFNYIGQNPEAGLNIGDYGLAPGTGPGFNANGLFGQSVGSGSIPAVGISTGAGTLFGVDSSIAGLAASAGTTVGAPGWLDVVSNFIDSVGGNGSSVINALTGSGGSSSGLGNLLGTGANLLGGYLQGNAASNAAETQANAIRDAAKIAADAAKFRPVGVTTRFGQSQFGYDANGNLNSAGYNLSPDIKAQQDQLIANSGGFLNQYLSAQGATAPLGQAAQRAMTLGNGYLSTDPQAQAAKYLAEQQALLAPGNERQLSDLMNTLQQQGRMGLATGGTSTMASANPALEAYYNSVKQQNNQLAANATQGGMDYAKFGAGLTGLGGDLLNQQYNTQTNAFKPYQTSLGGAQTLEGLGQNALDQGINIGAKGTAASANSGQLLSNGLMSAAGVQAQANAQSPWGNLLAGAGNALGNYTQQQQYNYDPITGKQIRWGV